MKITQMKTAIEVAKLLSFSKAAERLGIPQSNVSKQVVSLEKELNISIFDRSGKICTKLTNAGKELIVQMKSVIEAYDMAVSIVKKESSEKKMLRIGFVTLISSSSRKSMLADFADKFREIEISLESKEQLLLIQEVIDGKLDAALILCDGPFTYAPLMKSALKNPILSFTKLQANPLHISFGLSHEFSRRMDEEGLCSLKLTDLGGQKLAFVNLNAIQIDTITPFVELCAQHNVHPHIEKINVTSGSILLNLAVKGIVIVPSLFPPEECYPGLRILPVECPDMETSLVLLSRRENNSEQLKRFIDFAVFYYN